MSITYNNEITLKIKGSLNEFYLILDKKGFKIKKRFIMTDTFFIPKSLDITKLTIREILAKAILIRNFEERTRIFRCK